MMRNRFLIVTLDRAGRQSDVHRQRPARSRFLLCLCLAVVLFSGCEDPEQPQHGADYWPMSVGNTWTFSYEFSFRDWGNWGVGKAYEGSYSGTLSWEILTVHESQDGIVCSVRQRFVGTASEAQLLAEPNQTGTVTFDIADTTSTFDISVASNGLVRFGTVPSANWHYGCFQTLFHDLNVFRYRDPSESAIVEFSNPPMTWAVVKLTRGVGPSSIYYQIGGNTQRRALSASLSSHKP